MLVAFLLRIVLTYPVFNDITDEQGHIIAGLEFLETGKYEFESQHPPVSRLVLGFLPYYLGGLRYGGHRSLWFDGAWGTHDEKFYWKTLSLARAGNLIFAVLIFFFVYRWAILLYGQGAALAACTLAVCCPNLIAHASLATIDISVAATVLMAAFFSWRWSERPAWRYCLGAAAAFSLAVLCKFSALAFLPPIAAVYFVTGRWERWKAAGGPAIRELRMGLLLAAAFCLLAGLILWAGYGFNVGYVAPRGHQVTSGFQMGSETSLPHRLARALEARVLPAPKLWQGLIEVLSHNEEGHPAYLLGKVSTEGRWYYFPVAVSVKTTLPLLLLAAIGAWLAARSRAGLYPIAAIAVILNIAMAGRLNIGIRHVLPIYPFFAILGSSVFAEGRNWGRTSRVVLMALLAWHAAESLVAHPDYLAYFNEIAAGNEERFLADSNLDWGQDLARLVKFTRERQIESVLLSYSGSSDPAKLGLRGSVFRWRPPQSGWVAVSVNHLVGLGIDPAYSAWLRTQPPVARVGKSICVYYFPPR
ncbi:MAG: glycosyltransferase family 39 protein [Acidobacteria bacterium]|nr:glycosyltransferase family 39 protein [Acidobacteriota bacterium]